MSKETYTSSLDFLSACAQLLGRSAHRGSKSTPVTSPVASPEVSTSEPPEPFTQGVGFDSSSPFLAGSFHCWIALDCQQAEHAGVLLPVPPG